MTPLGCHDAANPQTHPGGFGSKLSLAGAAAAARGPVGVAELSFAKAAPSPRAALQCPQPPLTQGTLVSAPAVQGPTRVVMVGEASQHEKEPRNN